MDASRRFGRRLALLVVAAAFVLVPTAAQADPGDYVGPIFGIDTGPDGRLLVANVGRGIVDGDTGGLIAPASEFSDSGLNDVAPIAGTDDLWAVTGGAPGIEDRQFLYRVDDSGNATVAADLWAFEEKFDPHRAADGLNSNPFDVEDLGGGEALVADAGGNDLLLVDKHGKVKLIAVLPDELVSTANAKAIVGCPDGPPAICNLPLMIPAEPVATSVAVGPDGAYYVGELKGFPAPFGESRVWRIEANARNARCGHSPLCTVVLDGFTSIIDLVFDPDGRLTVAQIDDASFFALGTPSSAGGSVRSCNLATDDVSGECDELVDGVPILTSITYRGDALWGSILALVPGAADVVLLMP